MKRDPFRRYLHKETVGLGEMQVFECEAIPLPPGTRSGRVRTPEEEKRLQRYLKKYMAKKKKDQGGKGKAAS